MPYASEVEILLVEDNRHDAELTLRALQKHHLANHLVHVKDGQEALDWLFQTGRYADRPDALPKIILLDLKLPKVDGVEVLRAIRSNPRTRRIPVVALTSSREEHDIIETYDLGVNSYIVKPVEFEQFSEAVAQAGHYWLLVNQHPRETP